MKNSLRFIALLLLSLVLCSTLNARYIKYGIHNIDIPKVSDYIFCHKGNFDSLINVLQYMQDTSGSNKDVIGFYVHENDIRYLYDEVIPQRYNLILVSKSDKNNKVSRGTQKLIMNYMETYISEIELGEELKNDLNDSFEGILEFRDVTILNTHFKNKNILSHSSFMRIETDKSSSSRDSVSCVTSSYIYLEKEKLLIDLHSYGNIEDLEFTRRINKKIALGFN